MGGRVIAAQRTCNLNLQQDTIEVCSPVSGPWREYIPSTLGWDVQVSGLVCTPEHADELIDVLTSRQKVRLSYYDPELRIVRSGYAIPTQLPIGADIHSLANYSLTFQGCGELGKVESHGLQYQGAMMEIQNRMFADNDSHTIIENKNPLPGSDVWMAVRKFHLDQVSSLRVSMGRGTVVLYREENPAILEERIIRMQNLLLIAENEIAHWRYKSGAQYKNQMLAPGDYYIAYMKSDESWISIDAISLPTE